MKKTKRPPGRPLTYSEETVPVTIYVPASKKKEFKEMAAKWLECFKALG